MAATDAPATGRQSAIGVSTPRRDSEPKVRGVTRFAADIPVNDLLHARLLLSHDAHALIKSIDTTAARELPGVVAVLTAEDLPIVATGSGRSKNPLAREEIMYAGQPIAIAVGETEAIAADAIELIELELEPVEAVVDVEGAVLPRAPRARLHTVDEDDEGDLGDAHAAVAAGGVGDEEELSENVLGTARLASGDVDVALAAGEVVVRGRFHTPWVYQGYLEPQTATAWFDVEGELIVSTSTQAPFMTRDEVASLFGLPVDRVRVRCAPIGGGFGGKMMIPEPLAVSAVLSTRRPLRRGPPRDDSQRGLRGLQSGGRRSARGRARRRSRGELHRDPDPHLVRSRLERQHGGGVDRGDAVRRPLPLASPSPHLLRGHDQSRHVRRLPRPDGTARRVRGRVADRRAGGAAWDRPARAAAA